MKDKDTPQDLAQALQKYDCAETAKEQRGLLPEIERLLRQQRPDGAPDGGSLEAALEAPLDAALNHSAENNEGIPDYPALALRLARLPDVREALNKAPPRLQALAAWKGKPLPEPVITRDGYGPVLSRGEVCILSGEGGLGKSFLSLGLALKAARGGGEYCGLKVADGPACMFAYEDSGARLSHRAESMEAPEQVPERIALLDSPPPLFVADSRNRGIAKPSHAWGAIWQQVRELKPALVVIDPVSAALEGASVTEGGPVRAFIQALQSEAAAARCGALLVAHPNKTGRKALEANSGDAIAGSATWWDAARSVLALSSDGNDGYKLECIKNNYGRTWRDKGPDNSREKAIALAERIADGEYAGLTAANAGDNPWRNALPAQ